MNTSVNANYKQKYKQIRKVDSLLTVKCKVPTGNSGDGARVVKKKSLCNLTAKTWTGKNDQ